MHSLLAAKDIEDLRRQLISIDVEVPYHPRDRTNHHVETYSLVSLLGSLSWSSSCFPVEVFRRERPDFLVVCNSHLIGLEHTEGISQNLAKERALRADGHGSGIHFVTSASVNEPSMTKGELLAQIESGDDGGGWYGDSVERNWADAMAQFIARKEVNARRDGYDLYGDNRLMIYDNWPAPALNHQRALSHLQTQLNETTAWSVFDCVYIIDERIVVEIRAGHSFYYDVWR